MTVALPVLATEFFTQPMFKHSLSKERLLFKLCEAKTRKLLELFFGLLFGCISFLAAILASIVAKRHCIISLRAKLSATKHSTCTSTLHTTPLHVAS